MDEISNWTIWKYPLDITDHQIIEIPEEYSILSAQLQGRQLCIWAAVEPENRTVPVRVRIVGTGHLISKQEMAELVYIGTVVSEQCGLVWHVFFEGIMKIMTVEEEERVSDEALVTDLLGNAWSWGRNRETHTGEVKFWADATDEVRDKLMERLAKLRKAKSQ